MDVVLLMHGSHVRRMHNYAHIFELLSRLRQAVDHPYLVVYGNNSAAKAGAGKMKRLKSKLESQSGEMDVCGALSYMVATLLAHRRNTMTRTYAFVGEL